MRCDRKKSPFQNLCTLYLKPQYYCFTLKKKKTQETDTDYADNIALPANTPAEAESLLHSLEQAAEGISLNMNANKTEYMCFKREGAIWN